MMKISTSTRFVLMTFLVLSGITHAQWTPLGDTMYSINSSERAGSAVALSDDAQTVIIGGEYSTENGINSGVARVFEWDGNSSWVQKGLDLYGTAVDDRFGHSVCISDDGNVIAIGASSIAGAAGAPGFVIVYSWNGSAWVQMGSTLDGEANGDRCGYSVSMNDDGTVVAYGSIGPGHVKVFEWNGTDWAQKGNTVSGVASDWFGNSLELNADGTQYIVGIQFANLFIGSAKVYRWDGLAWVQKGQTINGQINYDKAGSDVAISDDGSIIAVGSVECCNANSKEGVVKVYEYSGTDWDQKGSEIRGLDDGDHFASRISMNGAGTRIAATDLTVSASTYDWDGSDWDISGGWINGGSVDYNLEFDISISATGKELAFGDVSSSNALGYYGTTRVYSSDGEVGLADNNSSSHFQLFPNPSTSMIYIRPNVYTNHLKIEVMDLNGKVLQVQNFDDVSTTSIEIQGSGGVYLVRISSNDGASELFRVIKQ